MARSPLWHPHADLVVKSGQSTRILASSSSAVRMLVGQYRERGLNHGRAIYKKIVYGAEPSVVLYYWDRHDGDEWAGWWFGTEVGNGECWARCTGVNSDTPWAPPRTGWRIPCDAAEEPGNLVVDALLIGSVDEHPAPAVSAYNVWVASEDGEDLAIGDVISLGVSRGGCSHGKHGVAVLADGTTHPVEMVELSRQWSSDGEGSLKQWIRDRRAKLMKMASRPRRRTWVDDEEVENINDVGDNMSPRDM